MANVVPNSLGFTFGQPLSHLIIYLLQYNENTQNSRNKYLQIVQAFVPEAENEPASSCAHCATELVKNEHVL